MKISPPIDTDFGFYNNYIYKIKDKDLITALHDNWTEIKAMADGLTKDELSYRYDTGKWSIKEVFVHLVDAERNFAYRIMRASRGDQGILPAYNIHDFILNAHADQRSMANIMQELELLRKTTITMFEGIHPDMLDKTSPARDVMVSVRAFGFCIAGHAVHHMEVIRKKYLVAVSG